MVGGTEFRPITSACWDADVRLADMDRDGVDLQVVSATPVLFAYGRPAAQAMECARIFNDALLELCAAGRGRLVPIAQVPLQDTELACRELDRCLAAGMRGVQIGNHVGDRDLDDDALVEFLAHCAGHRRRPCSCTRGTCSAGAGSRRGCCAGRWRCRPRPSCR